MRTWFEDEFNGNERRQLKEWPHCSRDRYQAEGSAT